MRYKIVIDSCGELVEKWKDSPAVERASLTLTVDDEDIIDDDTFDQAYFLKRSCRESKLPEIILPVTKNVICQRMIVRQNTYMQ